MDNIDRLIAFINDHKPARCLSYTASDKMLTVSTVAVDRDGVQEIVYEKIQPTLKAVRDWLGY